MKYLYGTDTKNTHLSFLKNVGAIASRGPGKLGPKAPPQHTAKSTTKKESRAGRRQRRKYKAYEAEGRRELHKATRIARQEKKAKRAAEKRKQEHS